MDEIMLEGQHTRTHRQKTHRDDRYDLRRRTILSRRVSSSLSIMYVDPGSTFRAFGAMRYVGSRSSRYMYDNEKAKVAVFSCVEVSRYVGKNLGA